MKGIVGRGWAERERAGMEVVRKRIVSCEWAEGEEIKVGRRARTENSVSGVSWGR